MSEIKYKYFKRKSGVGAFTAAGVLYNRSTVTRYKEGAVPEQVQEFVRQSLLTTATEKEFNDVNGEAIAKTEAAHKAKIAETETLHSKMELGKTLDEAKKEVAEENAETDVETEEERLEAEKKKAEAAEKKRKSDEAKKIADEEKEKEKQRKSAEKKEADDKKAADKVEALKNQTPPPAN